MIKLKLIGDSRDLDLLISWCHDCSNLPVGVLQWGLSTMWVEINAAQLADFEKEAAEFDIVVERL